VITFIIDDKKMHSWNLRKSVGGCSCEISVITETTLFKSKSLKYGIQNHQNQGEKRLVTASR